LLLSLSNETTDLTYLKDLHEKGFPIVFFDRITEEIDTHKVVADNRLGALHATEHLIFQGYKKIAHITNSPYLSITKERLQGYKEALEKHNLPYNDALIKYCNHGGMIFAEIEEAVNSLYKTKNKPDAIFTASDRITTVCLDVLKRKQKREVGLIGFTNTNLGDLFLTPLSVIRQPAFDIGQNATELLIQIIESKRPVTEFETRVLNTELIIRESSLKKS
jgi:LacI family transcriptional regulator